MRLGSTSPTSRGKLGDRKMGRATLFSIPSHLGYRWSQQWTLMAVSGSLYLIPTPNQTWLHYFCIIWRENWTERLQDGLKIQWFCGIMQRITRASKQKQLQDYLVYSSYIRVHIATQQLLSSCSSVGWSTASLIQTTWQQVKSKFSALSNH